MKKNSVASSVAALAQQLEAYSRVLKGMNMLMPDPT